MVSKGKEFNSIEHALQCAEAAPFYAERDLVEAFRSGGLSAIDLTHPDDLRQEPLAFLPATIDSSTLYGPFTTSGTTGKAKAIYLSPRDTVELGNRYFDGVGHGLPVIGPDDHYLVAMLDRPGSLGRYIADVVMPKAGYTAETCSPLDVEVLAERIIDYPHPFVLRTGLPIAARVLDILTDRGISHGISRIHGIHLGGSVMTPSSLERIRDGFGVPVHAVYGMTEIGGAFVASAVKPCSRRYRFVQRDYMIQELVPTNRRDGLHEVVLTLLRREGTQLIRYATRDLVRVMDDSRTFEIVGRFDDEVIFGHMNLLWNTEVEAAIEQRLGTSDFSVALEQNNRGMDTLTITVADESLTTDPVTGLVDALASIDPVIGRHYSAGYFQVRQQQGKTSIERIGHKQIRFRDYRRQDDALMNDYGSKPT